MRGRTNKHMSMDKTACRKGKFNTGQDKVTVKILEKKKQALIRRASTREMYVREDKRITELELGEHL